MSEGCPWSSELFPGPLERIDQTVRRRVMGRRLFLVLQLRKNLVCKLLPQLHTPLVEAENIPDHPLNKDLVLVHGNETSQRPGSDLFDKNGVGRPVSFKYLERNESGHLLIADPCPLELLNDLLLCLSFHQRFGLGKEIGEEDGMVISDGIVTDGGRDEIAGDQFCSLMDQLIEGVLPVRPGFPPDDRARLVANFTATPVNELSIALHIPLLKVGWKAVHVLVIG